jgi:hypothetical protein
MDKQIQAPQTKPHKFYNLAEIEIFIEEYTDWYNKTQGVAIDDGSNPPTPPPPPPGTKP